ncbi:MAG: holo-[acyl-carrier-protein] synthase [Opitutales bacterium]|jgi:holo-[acyl-carrier protein] synthase|nr:MAG: holo-[acyl-carrier-protein] synthase [Opitutales bacterium]
MKLEGGNVIGVGVDLTEVARIRAAHQRHGAHFLDKIFTASEQKICLAKADPYPSFAARFAAKEAVSKAFGTGIGAEFSLTSVAILGGPEGEPMVELDAKAQALLVKRGAVKVLVSLTHTDTLAQAFAVLVS